jgi:hypothetical protein
MRPVRRLHFLIITALVLLLRCGHGESPSRPSVPSPIPSTTAVTLSLVDGDGKAVSDARLEVDGVSRSARTAGGNVFDLDRGVVGHALDVDREGFLLHQDFVPDRDRALDLFAVPKDGSKAWIRALLYDGVIDRSFNLARLTQPVSILRGASVSAEDWEHVRGVVLAASNRMGGVTGLAFQVTDHLLPGTIPYTFELNPTLGYGGYFEWFGAGDTIQRGTVQFRSVEHMASFSLVLHELTHGFGLSHSDRITDVMHPSAVSDTHSERELGVIASVKRRPPGTAYEDNVRAATRVQAREPASGSAACGTSSRLPRER